MRSNKYLALCAALVAAGVSPSWSGLFAPVGGAAPKEAKKAPSVFADDFRRPVSPGVSKTRVMRNAPPGRGSKASMTPCAPAGGSQLCTASRSVSAR